MEFPKTYIFLEKNKFSIGDYSILPIRYEDRYKIMDWRNQQIYHLRQNEPLTKEKQDIYFEKVVSQLFTKEQPDQILFSYLFKDKCIGYGGLVHINWIDKNAEISFIMNTSLEKEEFKKHWSFFLNLIEDVAFKELAFHKIYTYAFDLRPLLYEVLEEVGFAREAILHEHCFIDDEYKSVIIHSKFKRQLSIRKINEKDINLLYEWSNDKVTRKNSYNPDVILFENHKKWFENKLKDSHAFYYICEVDGNPAGLVRFDIQTENEAIIGINIASNFRGKKLSSGFLIIACRAFRMIKPHRILAYIKKQNISSIRAFENASFIKKERLNYKGEPSYLYIYER